MIIYKIRYTNNNGEKVPSEEYTNLKKAIKVAIYLADRSNVCIDVYKVEKIKTLPQKVYHKKLLKEGKLKWLTQSNL